MLLILARSCSLFFLLQIGIALLSISSFSSALDAASLTSWDGTEHQGKIVFEKKRWVLLKGKDKELHADADIYEARFDAYSDNQDGNTASVYLLDHSILRGELRGLNSNDTELELVRGNNSISIPRTSIHAIDFSTLDDGAAVDGIDSATSYVIMKNGKVQAGTLDYFTSKTLGINNNDNRLRLDIERVHKMVLNPNRSKDPGENSQHCLRSIIGDVIYGKLLAYAKQEATIEHSLGNITIPRAQVMLISNQSDRVVKLTKESITDVKETPAIDFIRQWVWNKNLFGAPLIVANTPIDHGFATHARWQGKIIIPEGATRFNCAVGLDDSINKHGACAVSIRSGEQVLFKEALTVKSGLQHLSIPVVGLSALEVIVDFGADKSSAGDHCIFAWPNFIK